MGPADAAGASATLRSANAMKPVPPGRAVRHDRRVLSRLDTAAVEAPCVLALAPPIAPRRRAVVASALLRTIRVAAAVSSGVGVQERVAVVTGRDECLLH